MEESTVVIMVIGFILVIITVFAIVKSGGDADDNRRWNNLLVEIADNYPNATYSAQLEFLRRDKYLAIREATLKHEDISDLTEDYQMILDEQERLTEGDRQLGGEFQPFVPNQNTERI